MRIVAPFSAIFKASRAHIWRKTPHHANFTTAVALLRHRSAIDSR
jgi:hypothetical protein